MRKQNIKIENFKHFKGQHCETTATGSLLNQIRIELSEPMLFGIGELIYDLEKKPVSKSE